MGILQKLADGSVQVTESFDVRPFGTEDDRSKFQLAMTEASKTGKKTKLVAKIAAMPSSVTRNKTFYPASELTDSLESWTNPYPCPVIKDHNEYNVDGIVGRINKAYMQEDAGTDTLWFEVSILDPVAQEKVADGTWAQVSIGTRVNSAVCSVCGNDWAKGTWCEHERGNYYLKDEEDPNSVTMCFWTMGGITGREVSFVTTPSAATAGVRDVNSESESPSDEEVDRTFSNMILAWAESDETIEATLSAIESANNGSPAGKTGEATVPSEVEEGEQMFEVDKTEQDIETPSGAAPEGEEVVEGTEDTQVDGQGTEGAEDVPSAEDEGEEPETPEATAEDEDDPESPASDEGAEAAEEAAPGEEEEPEASADEDDERTELLARVAELEGTVLSLKAQLYVEAGLRDGILSGERDALVETHESMTESTLDELIGSVSQRRSKTNVSEELLKHELPKEQLPAGVEDDKNAGRSSEELEVSIKTGSGEHTVTLVEDDTPITVTPKL